MHWIMKNNEIYRIYLNSFLNESIVGYVFQEFHLPQLSTRHEMWQVAAISAMPTLPMPRVRAQRRLSDERVHEYPTRSRLAAPRRHSFSDGKEGVQSSDIFSLLLLFRDTARRDTGQLRGKQTLYSPVLNFHQWLWPQIYVFGRDAINSGKRAY